MPQGRPSCVPLVLFTAKLQKVCAYQRMHLVPQALQDPVSWTDQHWKDTAPLAVLLQLPIAGGMLGLLVISGDHDFRLHGQSLLYLITLMRVLTGW